MEQVDESGSNPTVEEDLPSPTPDLARLLTYLIRSRGVHVFNRNDEDDEESEEDDYGIDDQEEFLMPSQIPPVEVNPDTSVIDASDLRQELLNDFFPYKPGAPRDQRPSVCQLLQQREQGNLKRIDFPKAVCRTASSCYLPNKKDVKARFNNKVFCGTYSQSGDVFLSACQDRQIRIYDTSYGRFKKFNSLHALDVGWSVLDTAFSPDGCYLVYSSWSDYLHLCDIHGQHRGHHTLPLIPDSQHGFCIFSVIFSQDNKEILGGANDRCLYVYDRERNERTLRVEAHEDDVNAVAFADEGSQILFSGSDDGLCKIWDRRNLRESDPRHVGILAGHLDGITFIDSKGDGRYLLSNCKDQSIKLWDMRNLSTEKAQDNTRQHVARQNWDYRWQQVPKKVFRNRKKIAGDSSLMTYRGHTVLNTLIRSRFSPQFTTGQRYIYSGCASGAVVIYDILTGEIIKKLQGHKACVRDVSWHPYDNLLMSTSWDCSVIQWSYQPNDSEEDIQFSDKKTCPSKCSSRRKTPSYRR